MIGRQRQRPIEALQRLLVALEHVQHLRKVRQRVGRARLNLERGRDQPVCLAEFAVLVLQHAEQMQRVKIARDRA